MGRVIELVVSGNISAKKNLLRFNSRSHHPFYSSELRAELDELVDQIADQWSRIRVGVGLTGQPLVHPALGVTFYGQNTRSDRDGKLTTLLDALVSAGVLKDDCIAEFNELCLLGRSYEAPVGLRGARLFLQTDGNFESLWRHMRNTDLNDITPVKDWGLTRRASKPRAFRGRIVRPTRTGAA